jgi:hypothetical protein
VLNLTFLLLSCSVPGCGKEVGIESYSFAVIYIYIYQHMHINCIKLQVIHKHQPSYMFCMDNLKLYTIHVHMLVCINAYKLNARNG